MTLYYIDIKSKNKELDKSISQSSISFISEIAFNLNDKICFNSNQDDWQKELIKEYDTKVFKIIDRTIQVQDMHGDLLIDTCVELLLKPVY